ncbi:hypothetical protein ZTR_06044 [Talaromyces verruculosus]|nr:hypothetical protein ZTR_06044 [Talaromyces verruculosus]
MGLFSTSSSVSFDPSVDIPSLSGKVILVTGGNSGLGKQSIVELAKHHPAQIWLAARSLVKGNEAASDIRNQVPGVNIKVLELDLGSVKSIQHAATVFCQDSPRLDILLLNAGVMALPPGITADGYEIQFGTNHLGHALLTKLLLPVLLQTAGRDVGSDVRIVVLSSAAHTVVPNGADKIASGVYYEPVGVAGKESRYAKDPELAKKLWDWTEKELAQFDASPPGKRN